MFTQLKERARRSLAALTAAAVLAGTVLVGFAAPAAADDDVVVPSVTVSKTEGLVDGETITVTGSGFLPGEGDSTLGTRQPLAGKFVGTYVVLGKFADEWKPSEGVASSARAVVAQKWAVPAESVLTIGGTGNGAVELNADGSFVAELVVKSTELAEIAAGNIGVYTYPGGGAKYAPFETYTPVSLAEAIPAPSVTSSATAANATDGLTVSVTGENFKDLPKTSTDKDAVGVYVALVDSAIADLDVTADNVAKVEFLYGVGTSRGTPAFAKDVVAAPAALNALKSYKVVVWAAHGDVTESTLLASVPVTVSAEQWTQVFPETIKSVKAPVVSGSAKFNSTLSASAGTWDVTGATAKYQWLRNGVAISGATAAKYKLTSADVAKKISVKVTATKATYKNGSAISAAVTVAKADAPKATKAPSITGTAKFNSTLKVKAGTWNVSGVKYKYQWLRNGKTIKNATKSSYKLTSADVAKKITVKVTATKANYKNGTKTSKATAKVAKVTPTVTAKLAKTSIKKSQKTTVTVKVKASGVAKPVGKVTVKVGSKTFTKTLKASNKGTVKVTVKNLKKGSKQKVTVKYAPSSSSKTVLKSKTVSAKKLTVK